MSWRRRGGARRTGALGTGPCARCLRAVARGTRRLCVVVVLAAATPAAAHEIGTTQVTARLDVRTRQLGGTYQITIETDAEALLEKLEAVADRDPPGATVADLATRWAALEETFRERVAISFDGAASRPTIAFRVTPPQEDLTGAAATILLSGAVPPADVRFEWRYGWTVASYALRVSGPDEASSVIEWLEGGEASRPYAFDARALPARGHLSVARQYLALGLTHIVPRGLDHVLFVLGLFLLSPRWRSVFWQVSAFTIAHSITLGLGMCGVIDVPPAIVEPLIALSIAFVAIENLMRADLHPWRLAMVFGFGLVHGLGFAGVLNALGLPRRDFLTALVSFNVGVEGGQLLVIAGAFALVGWYQGQPSYRTRVVLPASLAIASIAIYWTIERAVVLL